jgi:HAE1 family hydrophobic/amphiphilic exporter-1
MFISAVAIRRPMLTSMAILAVVVFGIVSLWGLGVDLTPKVDFPVVSIVSKLPGADPETIERQMSDPMEAAVNSLSGIKTLRSTSAEGYSLITVEFELEKNIDVAYQEVQARINSIRSQLPVDMQDPVIEKFDFDAAPILTLVVYGNLGDRELYRIADKQVKERLQRIRNVGDVKLVGGRDRKLWLWLDPQRMKEHNLTVQDVRGALVRQHVETPGGRIEDGRTELVTRTKAEFQSAAELDELVLASTGGGMIRLKDVGRAEDGLEELRSYSQRGDKPGIALQIQRQSGTNTVQVAKDVKAEIDKIRSELAPSGVGLDITIDLSTYIERSVDEVYHHLIVGGCLAVLTVLLFLLNFRSTFISALVLPTSVLATFIFLAAMGFTLNMMTLMALTLAIGLLIDDAIVVQENIMRHVQAGKPASWAAEFATREIGLAVMATSFSVVAVFLPTAYTKGIVGRFFFPFGMTISFAVLISMLVSFTLDPMLSSRLLRKRSTMNPVFRALEAAFKKAEGAYGVMLGWCLANRWKVVALAVALFAGAMTLGMFVKAEFQPNEDRSEFDIMVKAPLGASIDQTRGVMEDIRRRLAGVPEVAYTFYSIGAGDTGKVNEGTMFVKLLPKEDRQKARQRGQEAMMEYARQKVADIPRVRTSVQQTNEMGGNSGWRATAIQYELCGPDLDVLDRIVKGHQERMRKDGGFTDIDSTYEAGRPEISIFPNRDRATQLGVSPKDIADTVAAAIGGANIAKFRSGSDRYDIAVRFLESGRNDPQRILELAVPSTKSGNIEIRNVAAVAPSAVPVEINRYNRQRSITLLANLPKGGTLDEASKRIESYTHDISLPAGFHASWTGQTQMMQESFANMGFTMILSVLVIYMVLAAQFESPVHPLTIMLSLPLAFVGALVALLIFGQTVNIFTIMAFIFLLGLVTKNAILLIDYTNTLRNRDGLPRDEALRRAGPIRLRPILMTTVAMIFGMAPAAVGTGSGSESRQPMAIAIIGGLVSSTMLTLLVVPVVYSLLDPLSQFFYRKVLKTKDHADGPDQSKPIDEPQDEPQLPVKGCKSPV